MMEAQRTTVLVARDINGKKLHIGFCEDCWTVIDKVEGYRCLGYLHLGSDSAMKITEKCRDMIVKYMYSKERRAEGLPGVGLTPQELYFEGLYLERIE